MKTERVIHISKPEITIRYDGNKHWNFMDRNVFMNGADNTVKHKIRVIEIQPKRNTKIRVLPEMTEAIGTTSELFA